MSTGAASKGNALNAALTMNPLMSDLIGFRQPEYLEVLVPYGPYML